MWAWSATEVSILIIIIISGARSPFNLWGWVPLQSEGLMESYLCGAGPPMG